MVSDKELLMETISKYIEAANIDDIDFDVTRYTIPCVSESGGTVYKQSGRVELKLNITIMNMNCR